MAKKHTKARKRKARRASSARANAREVGRPTDYRPEFCEDVRKLCLLGATDEEVADFFGVSPATIDNWKVEYPEFLGSIRAGKLKADAEMADRLFARGMGYSHQAVKIAVDAKTGMDHQVEYTEHYPPDTEAAKFWLKNRRPEIWRDKQDLEHSGPNKGPIETKTTVAPDDAYLRMLKRPKGK